MLITLLLLVVAILALLLTVSRNADLEGEAQAEREAAHATGAVMIPDSIDYTDASYLDQPEDED